VATRSTNGAATKSSLRTVCIVIAFTSHSLHANLFDIRHRAQRSRRAAEATSTANGAATISNFRSFWTNIDLHLLLHRSISSMSWLSSSRSS